MYKSGTQFVRDGVRVDIRQISVPLVIKEVKGEWLDIGPAQIKITDAVPLEHAIDYYTDYLDQNPMSSWAYNLRAIAWRQWGQAENAIDDYTSAIRLNPKSATTYSNRSSLWTAKGDLDKALRDLDEAIRLDAKYIRAYYRRGNVLRAKRQYDAALKDYDEAIRLDPKFTWAYNNRGVTWKAKGNLDAAVKDYEEAVRLDPEYATALNNLAWVRATANNEKFRNAQQAVECATKACELTFWKDATMLSTLAAAYAESGDFVRAIQWQTAAIDLAPETNKAGYRTRVDLFLSGKPYRELLRLQQAK